MWKNLLKSKLRGQVLLYFFANPESRLYLREIAKILSVDPGNLSKELAALSREGIFLAQERGNQKYFELNGSYPLFNELKSIIDKTIGVESLLKQCVSSFKSIDAAFIYGSFVSGRMQAQSDIDLFIIGRADEDLLNERIEKLEKKIGREINYNIYSKVEIFERMRKQDSFIKNIFKRPKIVLTGKLDEFR